MKPINKKFWFPAKRYGWGWGPPCAWQGWVVMLVWLVLLTVEMALIVPQHPGLAVAIAGLLSALLFLICWIKGERPRWRWGNDSVISCRARSPVRAFCARSTAQYGI